MNQPIKSRVEFGDTNVEITQYSGNLEDLMDVVRMAVKGCGYSDALVDRYMPDPPEIDIEELRHG